MAETISIKDFYYGPNPFDFRLGGNRYIDFTLEFSGTPPATFDYTVSIKDEKGGTPKTFNLTNVPVNPDGTGTIHIAWDGTMSPQKVPVGSYRPEVEASASGYDNLQEGVCSGANNNPAGGGGGCGGKCNSGCP